MKKLHYYFALIFFLVFLSSCTLNTKVDSSPQITNNSDRSSKQIEHPILTNTIPVTDKPSSIETPTLEKSFVENEDIDHLHPFIEGDKWGYMNSNGTVIIPPHFDDAEEFSEGLAAVHLADKLSYINTKGEVLIQVPDFRIGRPFSDGYAVVLNGTDIKYIDRNGNISFEKLTSQTEVPMPFSEGLALQFRFAEQKIGYINISGDWAIPPTFSKAKPFSQQLAAVSTDGTHWGFINEKGQQVVAELYMDVGSYSENLSSFKIGDKWGYMNTKGEQVIAAQFELAGQFSEGLANVVMHNKYGFINNKGEWVIQPSYTTAESFSEGLALAERENMFGFIDRTGRFVIQPIYRYTYKSHFQDGIAWMMLGNKVGYIDKSGKAIHDFSAMKE